MIVGAHAVFVHGFPRTSLDLDIALPLQPEERDRVRVALEGKVFDSFHWAVDPEWGQRYRCKHGSGLPVELFFSGHTEVGRREFGRRVAKKVRGTSVWFISPEDLVLRKLVNCRLRSGVDFDDVVGVLRVQGTKFDSAYVKNHCAVYRVCGLFDQALRFASQNLP